MPETTIAVRSLQQALSVMPQSSDWRSLIADRVESLRGAYLQELESGPAADAYALDAPWICGRLQILRREQRRIVDELEALARACVEALDMETLRVQVQFALQRIARAQQRENDLIYESVDLDLGGEQ